MKIKKQIFLFLYGLYAYIKVLDFSLIDIRVIRNITFVVVSIILFLVYITNKLNTKEIILSLLLEVVFTFSAIKTNRLEIIVIVTFLVCANFSPFIDIVKTSLVANILGVFTVMSACFLGIVENIQIYSHTKYVSCYGFTYYSTLPFIFFYIILMWIYIHKELNYFEISIWLIVAIIVFDEFRNNLTFILSIFVIGLYIICIKLQKGSINNVVLRTFSKFSFSVIAFITNIIMYMYNSKNLFWRNINLFLVGRLYFGHRAFELYPITLLGQIVEMGTNVDENRYFYIDSGFVYAFIAYGVLFFFMVIILYTQTYKSAVVNNDKRIFIWVTTNLVFSVINNTWINISYNPLLFLGTQLFLIG